MQKPLLLHLTCVTRLQNASVKCQNTLVKLELHQRNRLALLEASGLAASNDTKPDVKEITVTTFCRQHDG